ncbi:MAG: hypothetical protein GXY83_17105, partial [Rhodopirellula sp.]|nr:hypothetical protein [Rhodopirellula sp.]
MTVAKHSVWVTSSLLIVRLILLKESLAVAAAQPDIQAGVAVVDITPARNGEPFFDPLFAKAVVFRQAERKAALVMCDLVQV